jgi:SAM-dependent methyltransferase
MQKLNVNCYICKKNEFFFVASGVDREYYTTPDVFDVVECLNCKLRYLNPRPTVSELPVIYPSNYYSYHMDIDPSKLGIASRLRHRVHGRRFRGLLKNLEGRATIDLLDVGCGDGWMLYLFKLADPDRITTYGVDINEQVCASARARGHIVYCGLFEDTVFDQKFDVINLSNVIEHVTDPVAVVKKSYSSLRAGGILILETPNRDSWDARLFRRGAWGSYHIPRHFTFFNPETIERLGSEAGFTMAEIRFSPAPTQWIWTMHNLFHGRKSAVSKFLAKIFEPADCFTSGVKPFLLLGFFTIFDWFGLKITGQTSNMTVVLKKSAPNPENG